MEENKERFYQSIGRILIIASIAILFAVTVVLLFGKYKPSSTYKLVYEKNITFNNFYMFIYKLEYCIGDLCITSKPEEYICTAKITNNTKCVILPTQLVCEKGVVCYPLRGMFTNP